MEANRLAKQLLTLDRQARDRQFEQLEAHGNGEWAPLSDTTPSREGGAGTANGAIELLGQLDVVLRREGYDKMLSRGTPSGEPVVVVDRFLITHQIRSILRGFIQPVVLIPTFQVVSERVFHFIRSLPGGDDYLVGEMHHGIHYHYLDSKHRRSNVILCWDNHADVDENPYPLFWERHGEGKAGFKARSERWVLEKRVSMHTACLPDLETWPLKAFRCASNKAQPLWPIGTTLTTLKT
jgi:hypothetical protein